MTSQNPTAEFWPGLVPPSLVSTPVLAATRELPPIVVSSVVQ